MTVGIVDEMPESSELGPSQPAAREEQGLTMTVGKMPLPTGLSGTGTAEEAASRRPEESSNLSSLATPNAKPNV